MSDAARLVAELTRREQSVATAESLTGGLVAATLVDVPGASVVLRGGIVAYQSAVKERLVGVSGELLAAGGAVQAEVAAQLAGGAARVLGADWGIGTTGVAGPGPSEGHPAGTVFVAVWGPGVDLVDALQLTGGRAAVRAGAVAAALALLSRGLGV